MKFYAGAAAYFTFADGLEVLLWVSLIGAALIIGWMILRRLIGKSIRSITGSHALFPYGVAIMAGMSSLAWAKSPFF